MFHRSQGAISSASPSSHPTHGLTPAADHSTPEAEELLRKVLKRKEDLLGASHAETLLSIRNLASLLEVKRSFAEAGQLYLRELRGLEELHGPNHEMIQQSQRNLERAQQAHRLQTAAAMDVLPANQTIVKGMRCRYWSSTHGGRWLPACLTKVHGDGTVDLDIKKHASIENISPSPEVAEAEAWPPGPSVSYNSSTAKRWIPAVVQSFNSMSSTNPVGSYNLEGVSRGEACKMAYAKQGQEGKSRLERLQDTVRDFGHFLYNRDGENGETLVMGRNGKSWAKILFFFFVFYGCLAAFFASMLAIFMSTVPPREEGPKMTRYLAGKPGLIPLPTEITTNADVKEIVSSINKFLKPYKEAVENLDDKYQNCTDDEREKGSKPCVMDLTSLGECYNNSAGFQYGYDEEKPCIFMKMNRVYNWAPEPNDGKDYVELSCKFEEGDSDNLSILPSDKPGFLAKFYPYFSEETWLAPIAAVKVNTKSAGIILCEALAKNIELSDTYRLNRGATGKARIEIKQ